MASSTGEGDKNNNFVHIVIKKTNAQKFPIPEGIYYLEPFT